MSQVSPSVQANQICWSPYSSGMLEGSWDCIQDWWERNAIHLGIERRYVSLGSLRAKQEFSTCGCEVRVATNFWFILSPLIWNKQATDVCVCVCVCGISLNMCTHSSPGPGTTLNTRVTKMGGTKRRVCKHRYKLNWWIEMKLDMQIT